jgi:two-component system response regulator AtoC
MNAVESREFPQIMSKNFAMPRVLIVDDEPLIRWSLAETLTERGCHVVQAEDAAGTRAVVAEENAAFDVVLLDFRLPDSDSLSLLASIRGLAPHAQVILMTAFGRPDIVQGALDLGAFRVIGKPFEMSAIADLVAEAHAAGQTH